MTMKFEEWIVGQKGRQDFIGDFARMLKPPKFEEELSRRKPDEHRKWADVVIGMSHPGHIAAFNRAWQEFQGVQSQNGMNDSS